MSWQSRIGRRWVRFYVKRKPAGQAALVDFTRRRFSTPAWLVWLHSLGVKIERVEAPVKGEWLSPGDGPTTDRVVYYLHGGGYISGSAKSCRPITATLARLLNGRVFGLDYRLAPEQPFPAGLDDAVAGYRWLLSSGIDPKSIAIVGDSAGGGMTLAVALRIREAGEPLPRCLVCFSPPAYISRHIVLPTATNHRHSVIVLE